MKCYSASYLKCSAILLIFHADPEFFYRRRMVLELSARNTTEYSSYKV